MNNSFAEIMDPPWDRDARRLRLRWLGDGYTACAVKPRHLRSVPKIFVHYIEDYEESMRENTDLFLDELERKLHKDPTHTVSTDLRIFSDLLPWPEEPFERDGMMSELTHFMMEQSQHFIIKESPIPLLEALERFWTDHALGMIHPFLTRKTIMIPHQLSQHHHSQMSAFLEGISRGVSYKQSYYPWQRPSIRVHSFLDEDKFMTDGVP